MRSSLQLPLPLPSRCAFGRDDLIVDSANERAVGFIDSWPDWPARVAAIFGRPGCGKTHLTSIWRERSGARILVAAEIAGHNFQRGEMLAVEDVDSTDASPERDAALFGLIESGNGWILFTGRTPPATWVCALPDLASRFSSLTALQLHAPDEALLAALARRLFSDRQLIVPDGVIEAMLCRLERSAGAIRDFVAELDAAALATARPITLTLVRNLIAAREPGAP
jgi:chromosomal replication initiation ATPase DnaA